MIHSSSLGLEYTMFLLILVSSCFLSFVLSYSAILYPRIVCNPHAHRDYLTGRNSFTYIFHLGFRRGFTWLLSYVGCFRGAIRYTLSWSVIYVSRRSSCRQSYDSHRRHWFSGTLHFRQLHLELTSEIEEWDTFLGTFRRPTGEATVRKMSVEERRGIFSILPFSLNYDEPQHDVAGVCGSINCTMADSIYCDDYTCLGTTSSSAICRTFSA